MAEEQDAPKGKSKLLIIIIAVVVLLLGIGGALFFFLGSDDSASESQSKVTNSDWEILPRGNKFLPRVWSSSAFFSAAFACASAALALATCLCQVSTTPVVYQYQPFSEHKIAQEQLIRCLVLVF